MDPYVAEVLAEMAKGKEFDPYEFRDRREGLGDSSYVKEFRKREGSGLDLYDSSYDQVWSLEFFSVPLFLNNFQGLRSIEATRLT